ncbi:recombinase family protein, partial [Pseudomonas aeruginosa]
MKIGYARVSTRDQNADLQVDALKQAGCERIYQDIASGAKSARPELDKLLAHVRAGDTVVIWKLDRLGRSLKHLVELVGELAERKVGLQGTVAKLAMRQPFVLFKGLTFQKLCLP